MVEGRSACELLRGTRDYISFLRLRRTGAWARTCSELQPLPDLFAGHHGRQPSTGEPAAPLPHPDHARREAHADVSAEPDKT